MSTEVSRVTDVCPKCFWLRARIFFSIVVQFVAVWGLLVLGSGIFTIDSPPLERGLVVGRCRNISLNFQGSIELMLQLLRISSDVSEFECGRVFLVPSFAKCSHIFGNLTTLAPGRLEGTVCFQEVCR
jgi:hypothetical protein